MSEWWQKAYPGGPMVAVAGDCIIGQHLQGNGYARAKVNGERLLAHRVAWEQAHGPIPDGFQLHHRCGVKACVNVAHLELLTIGDHTRHHHPGPQCEHERGLRPDGRSYCPICERQWKQNGAEQRRRHRRERYATDPDYRAKVLEQGRRYRETRKT